MNNYWEKALGKPCPVPLYEFLKLQPNVLRDLKALKDKRGGLKRTCSTLGINPTDSEFEEALKLIRS